MLEIDGSVEVKCTIDAAWDLFCRFGDVAALIPTVEEVEVEGDRVYARVVAKLGVLPVSSRVNIEVTERKPYACLKAVGVSYLGETIREQISPHKEIRGINAESAGHLMLHLDLRPGESDDHVRVIYHAEVEAEGRLKRIYQSILKTKAPAMMAEFAENIRTTLEAPAAVEPTTPTTSQPERALDRPRQSLWIRFVAWLRSLFTRRSQRS